MSPESEPLAPLAAQTWLPETGWITVLAGRARDVQQEAERFRVQGRPVRIVDVPTKAEVWGDDILLYEAMQDNQMVEDRLYEAERSACDAGLEL